MQAANRADLRHAETWAGMTRTGNHARKIDRQETGRFEQARTAVALDAGHEAIKTSCAVDHFHGLDDCLIGLAGMCSVASGIADTAWLVEKCLSLGASLVEMLGHCVAQPVALKRLLAFGVNLDEDTEPVGSVGEVLQGWQCSE